MGHVITLFCVDDTDDQDEERRDREREGQDERHDSQDEEREAQDEEWEGHDEGFESQQQGRRLDGEGQRFQQQSQQGDKQNHAQKGSRSGSATCRGKCLALTKEKEKLQEQLRRLKNSAILDCLQSPDFKIFLEYYFDTIAIKNTSNNYTIIKDATVFSNLSHFIKEFLKKILEVCQDMKEKVSVYIIVNSCLPNYKLACIHCIFVIHVSCTE